MIRPNHPWPRRLTADEIATHAERHPFVRLADGEWIRVDECGLLTPGRMWRVGRQPRHEQIRAAEEWLSLTQPIQTPTLSSYKLKHTAERWAGDYVSNGALIVAAHRSGIRMTPDDPAYRTSPNVILAISLRWYRKHLEELGRRRR